MRKNILNALGGILTFFGLFGFVLTFFDIGDSNVDTGTRITYAVILTIGVAIIVLNCIVKTKEECALSRYKKGKCPHCGATLEYKGKEADGVEKYECPKQHFSYGIKRDGKFTIETNKEGKQVLVAHDVFFQLCLDKIPLKKSAILERVFKAIEEEKHFQYDNDLPEVKQAVADAELMDNGRCPICKQDVCNRKKFVSGSGGTLTKEYEPAFIPSLGGAVFIEREVFKGAVPDHFVTVMSCGEHCHTKSLHKDRISRALVFRKKANANVDTMLRSAGYTFTINRQDGKE